MDSSEYAELEDESDRLPDAEPDEAVDDRDTAGERAREGPANRASWVGLSGLSEVIGGAGRENPERQLAGMA